MARPAYSLDVLLGQLNALYPKRDKVSDGWIGDTSHSNRVSDHNPDVFGIVRARDFTHDTTDGIDGEWLANELTTSGDTRIKYVIWNHRIWYPNVGWRSYGGINPHTHHLHLSVVSGSVADSLHKWDLGGFMADLSAQQQRDIYNRIMAMLRQRYYIVENGVAKEVQANHQGGKPLPCAVLDTLDGAYLVGKLEALEAEVKRLKGV